MALTLGIGTDKGLFWLSENGSGWQVSEPEFLGWRVTAVQQLSGGEILAGAASEWFGAAVHRSTDGHTWDQVVPGPAYGDDVPARLSQIWRFHEVGDALYCGVGDAGLFRSDDHATSWTHVAGLRDHPSAPHWEPGAGGLCAHSILHHPTDRDRMWVGISAVGVFRTDDGGATWELKNDGVTITAPPEGASGVDIGYCVHALVLDPDDPDVIYRQEHRGLFRTEDGGETWVDANEGVPARFGFPLVMDTSTGNLFSVPQISDEHRVPVDGRLRVYRSTDRARTWHDASVGISEAPGYAGVLRTAMATDNDGLVAFGTTSGDLYVSADSGDSWAPIEAKLPRIFSVSVVDL